MYIWWEFFRTSSPRRQHLLRELFLRKQGDESIIKKFSARDRQFASPRRPINNKRVLLSKENQISRSREFSNLSCMGKCKCLGSLSSLFHMHLSYLGQIFLIIHILNSLRSGGCGGWLPPVLSLILPAPQELT